MRPCVRFLVYREFPKDWEGPYVMEGTDGKLMWLNIKDRLKRFYIETLRVYKPQIRPVVAADDVSISDPPADSDVPGTTIRKAQAITKAPVGAMIADPPTDGTTADGSAIATGGVAISERSAIHGGVAAAAALVADIGRQVGGVPQKDARGFQDDQGVPSTSFITEALRHGDLRTLSPEMEAAKRAESDGLKRRRTWTKVHKRDVPAGSNILGARFVSAIKQPNTQAEKENSRFVAQGCGDKEKPFIVRNLSTLRQSSTKVIVSTSAVLCWRLLSHDVNQAYHTSKEAKTWDMYVRMRAKDVKYFCIADGELLQLLKPLYGVADSKDYWDVIFATHFKKDLGMSSLTGVPALLIKPNEDNIDGMLGEYLEDTCMGGKEKCQDLTLATLNKSESEPRAWDEFKCICVSVRTRTGA